MSPLAAIAFIFATIIAPSTFIHECRCHNDAIPPVLAISSFKYDVTHRALPLELGERFEMSEQVEQYIDLASARAIDART